MSKVGVNKEPFLSKIHKNFCGSANVHVRGIIVIFGSSFNRDDKNSDKMLANLEFRAKNSNKIRNLVVFIKMTLLGKLL